MSSEFPIAIVGHTLTEDRPYILVISWITREGLPHSEVITFESREARQEVFEDMQLHVIAGGGRIQKMADEFAEDEFDG